MTNLPARRLYTINGNAAGNQVVPAVAGSGSGTITGTYDPTTRMFNYTNTWTGLSGAPTGESVNAVSYCTLSITCFIIDNALLIGEEGRTNDYTMTENDKSLINLRFLNFSMNQLRKYFAESDLERIDRQMLLSNISKGATLIELKMHVTEMLSNKHFVKGRPPLQ